MYIKQEIATQEYPYYTYFIIQNTFTHLLQMNNILKYLFRRDLLNIRFIFMLNNPNR